MNRFAAVSHLLCVFVAPGFLAAATARADYITLQTINGNDNFLHAEFSLMWGTLTGPTQIQGSLSGSWPNGGPGTWKFSGSCTNLQNEFNEGFDDYVFSTVWNDGWTPFNLQASDFFVFGLGDSPINNSPPINHVLYTDAHGLTYYYTATLTGTRHALSDTSGNAYIYVDVSRVAVPEPSSVAFLILSLGGVGFWSAKYRAREIHWLPR